MTATTLKTEWEGLMGPLHMPNATPAMVSAFNELTVRLYMVEEIDWVDFLRAQHIIAAAKRRVSPQPAANA